MAQIFFQFGGAEQRDQPMDGAEWIQNGVRFEIGGVSPRTKSIWRKVSRVVSNAQTDMDSVVRVCHPYLSLS